MGIQTHLLFLAVILNCYIVIHAVSISKHPDSPGTFTTQHESNYLLANPGDDVVVICSERGSQNEPTINLLWRKDSIAIFSTAGEYMVEVTTEGTTLSYLTIHSVAQDDAGTYRCSSGSNFDEVFLFVTEPTVMPVEQNAPPTITFLPSNTNADLGSQVTLQCTADGNSLIKWRRPNQAFLETTNQNQLIFSLITLDDRGLYECVATNGFGETRQTTRISINGFTSSPVVTALNEVIGVKQGIQATLRCNATSSPRVEESQVQWFYEDIELSEQEQFATATTYFLRLAAEWDPYEETVLSGLVVPDVAANQIGNYTCRFENDQGFATANVRLEFIKVVAVSGGDLTDGTTKKAVEGGIRVTSAIPLTSTSVQVDWEGATKATALTSYRIRLTTSDGFMTEEYLTPTSRRAIFDDLTPATEYEVTVQAIYGTVYGAFEKPVLVSTHDENGCISVKSRRTDLSDLGTPCLFRGFVDVQGQGVANDYCRVVSTGGQQFLSCALAGSTVDHQYTSFNASSDWFDAGHTDTWFMADKDADGRDDYCRCVGVPPNTVVSCMKAGATGFISHDDFQIPGTAGCQYDKVNPFFGRP